MACKNDVKQAILNKVFQELIEGRYTFNRIAIDTAIVTNQGKAQSGKQALAIGNEVVKRAEKSFNGHVTGTVYQNSSYDPVIINFSVSDKYINHVYNSLPVNQQTDSTTLLDRERDEVNSNTGPNTYDQLNLFNVDEAIAGTFTKYIRFKETQLSNLRDTLNKIQRQKKQSGLTTEELTKLNTKEREVKLLIEGNFERGIKGLVEQIAELKKDAEVNSVGYYVEKDLQRIATLANSSDLDDLREAQRLIDFYTLAGSFTRGVENPFFEQDEIFLEDESGKLTTEFKLDNEVMAAYKEWSDRARLHQNVINKRYEEVAVDTVNADPSVRKTYGNREFGFNDLIYSENGLKDTDWVSMWTMDITSGIFSSNGIIPQVMFSYLSNNFEKRLAWARSVEERIDKLNPQVQSELIKLGYSLRAGGIIGLKGASYQLFKEITKEGNETGGLVQRFVKEFFDSQSNAMNSFSRMFTDARTVQDYQKKSALFNKAFENLKRWRRNNTIIMDMTRLPEFSESTDNSYKQYLVSMLGQKGYDEQVARQKKLLQKYEAERQSMIDAALIDENVDDFSKLSDKAKSDLSYWENNHSPFKGIEDYNSVSGIFFGDRKANNFMDYNNFIPRKYKVNIAVDSNNNNYLFTDSQQETGFYSEDYSKIESNPVLSQFYDVIREVCERIREEMPYEMQKKMAANTIPALNKTVAEIIADKNVGILRGLFEAYRHIKERVRLGFGVTKQSEISYATRDPLTGKANYTVNDQFIQGNSKAVSDRNTIEKAKFMQTFPSLKKITRFTNIPLASLNENSLIELAKYLHIDISLNDIRNGNINKIRDITGDSVEIGKYIRDYSIHTVVQSQSFDLAKIGKYFSNVTMAYAARQEALPILEIMKKHYEGISQPKTNNLNNTIRHATDGVMLMNGLRTKAIRQMDDWFERVALGNYETKHVGPHGNEAREGLSNSKFGKALDKLPKYRKEIYSDEDKKKIKEIDTLLLTETDEDEIKKLKAIKAGLGKIRTATAAFDNLLGWIRTLRLGYNVASATTNFMEGVTSNMIIGAMGDYFDPKELYYGYSVIKHSMLKNATFGAIEPGLAKRNRKLMDKFNVVMDSRNELQKSSNKTYADKLGWLNPHALNQRVEYINQSPIMIAMLRTLKIEGKDGTKTSIWDAYGNDGHLKDNFRTEENVRNWEELVGDDYLNFKQKLHKAIVLGHGNYDELRGMMIKSNSVGKALAMFKTWIPMQFYSRFAAEQDDIQSGTIGFKGRYRSYGKGSGLVHGAIIGTAIFGLPLGVAFGGVGYIVGKFFGVDTGVGMLQETIGTTKALLKKAFGMPVNLLAGRQLIKDDGKVFDSWVGKGDFSVQDAKNLKANMADLSLQLAWLALILMVKSLFWDDEDERDDPERIAHNILVNKLMQLSSQAAMYSGNLRAMWDATFADNAVVAYVTDLGKEADRLQMYFEGDDIIKSGINAGESGLANQSRKVFLPGLFKDGNPLINIANGEAPMLGFKSQSERVFEESPFHGWFKSNEKEEKENNQEIRAARRNELEELGLEDAEIKKILDEEAPTPSRLKKLDMTREEYEESRQQSE